MKIFVDQKTLNHAPDKFDDDGDLIIDRDLTLLLKFVRIKDVNILNEIFPMNFQRGIKIHGIPGQTIDSSGTSQSRMLIGSQIVFVVAKSNEEHALQTTLSDVGLQLWNGGALMCEFILSHKNIFESKVVFEFGAGIGLSSICLSAVRTRRIFATDLNIGSLRLAERNYALNSFASTSADVNFLLYDWSFDFADLKKCNTTPSFTWTELLINEAKSSDIFLAADVIYDIESAKLFYDRILSLRDCCDRNFRVFISLEKRYNFTMEDMDVICPYYERFSEFIESLPPDDWNVVQWGMKDIPDLISANLEFGRNENMV